MTHIDAISKMTKFIQLKRGHEHTMFFRLLGTIRGACGHPSILSMYKTKANVNKRCCSNINFDTIFDLLELRLA